MKEKGFTLIELLAVIVILAIIALIATPIILGIINDAREESQERSAELYLSGVELAVARKNLTEEFSPSECTIASGIVTCDGKKLQVDVDGDVPISGTIKFEDNKTTTGTILTFKGFTATINLEGQIVIGDSEESGDKFEIGKLSSVCEPAEKQYFQETAMEPGYEYNCTVDPNADPYTFYVLNKTENQINLIMDSNINISGRAVKGQETDLGNVVRSLDLIIYGTDLDENPNLYKSPIEALEYLQTATAGWTNVTPQEINSLEYPIDWDWFSETKLIPMEHTYTSNARLPYLSEIKKVEDHDAYEYIYDNLRLDCFDYEDNRISCEGVLDGSVEGYVEAGHYLEGLEHIEDVNGYWILFTDGANETASCLDYDGVFPSSYGYSSTTGVRPVITLNI